ncbi:hypothetical protein Cfor_11599 [Coptotermes formosanus]|uniref:Uncharacterized protein n=1 Tax=Coptotermes formosanus TaxID=36987 RepID=A0A6L2Q0H2_COPFO|nr:hypothetical protein Cfor_11599 [Coptotermes formosanus]
MSIGVAVLCLPWLRWTQPNLPRPIKVNLVFPIVYIIASLFVTIVPMIASPVETGYGCLMILTSVPVYLIFIAWKKKPKPIQQALEINTGIYSGIVPVKLICLLNYTELIAVHEQFEMCGCSTDV